MKSILGILGVLICAQQFSGLLLAQQPVPLDQLVLKGTHNSYACCGGGNIFYWDNSCPVMHNPLHEQMDDWNIWAFELDFSIKLVNGVPTAIVGHDGPSGDDSFTTPDWGTTVRDFMLAIKNSRSFEYRPAIVYFEKKNGWGENAYDAPSAWGPILDAVLLEVFGADAIFGPTAFAANGSAWPTVSQLAGKLVPGTITAYSSNLIFGGEPLPRFGSDVNVSEVERNAAIQSGQYDIIALDDYQQNWTFGGTAPPNPVYVKSNAAPFFIAVNQYGHNCGDFNDVDENFVMNQHGTFSFPFNRVGESVDKALPGWTLLLHTGTYPENITIKKALTLKADGGPVVIGN